MNANMRPPYLIATEEAILKILGGLVTMVLFCLWISILGGIAYLMIHFVGWWLFITVIILLVAYLIGDGVFN